MPKQLEFQYQSRTKHMEIHTHCEPSLVGLRSLSPSHVVRPDELIAAWVGDGSHLVHKHNWLLLIGRAYWWSLESQKRSGGWEVVLVVFSEVTGHVEYLVA